MPKADCPTCGGDGIVDNGKVCITCKGRGTLIINGPIIEKRDMKENKNLLESDKKDVKI